MNDWKMKSASACDNYPCLCVDHLPHATVVDAPKDADHVEENDWIVVEVTQQPAYLVQSCSLFPRLEVAFLDSPYHSHSVQFHELYINFAIVDVTVDCFVLIAPALLGSKVP